MHLFRDNNNYFIVDKKEVSKFYTKIEQNLYSTAFLSLDEVDYNNDSEELLFLNKKIPFAVSMGILDYIDYKSSFDSVMVKTYVVSNSDDIETVKNSLKEMIEFIELYLIEKNITNIIVDTKYDIYRLSELCDKLNIETTLFKRIIEYKRFIDLKNELDNKKMVAVLSEKFVFKNYVDSIIEELYNIDFISEKDLNQIKNLKKDNKEIPKTLLEKVARENILNITRMRIKLNFIYQFKSLDWSNAINSQMQKKPLDKLDIFNFKDRTIKEKRNDVKKNSK